jgi:hypothetical protein
MKLLNAVTVLAFTMGGNVYLAQASETPVNMGPLDDSLRLTLIEHGAVSAEGAVNLETITLAGGGGCDYQVFQDLWPKAGDRYQRVKPPKAHDGRFPVPAPGGGDTGRPTAAVDGVTDGKHIWPDAMQVEQDALAGIYDAGMAGSSSPPGEKKAPTSAALPHAIDAE